MFAHTDTEHAPWTVIKSNAKKRARLEAMRHVLSRLDDDEVSSPRTERGREPTAPKSPAQA